MTTPLSARRMTKYVGKISRWNYKRSLRKLQKISWWYFLPHPVYVSQPVREHTMSYSCC